MDKPICPDCGDVLMMGVNTDNTMEIRLQRTLMYFGDSRALMHCTEECGYKQNGFVRNLEICTTHGELIQGEFTPDP